MSDPTDHDPDEADALARVNRIRAARGRPPIVERDPAVVRRELVADRNAMMIAVAVLHEPGCGATVPDAIDHALESSGSSSAANVPRRVASAIINRIPSDDRPEAWHAVNSLLEQFGDTDRNRYLAELCVHRIARAVRLVMATSISDDMDAAAAYHHVTSDQVDKAAVQIADMVTLPAIVDRLRDDLEAMTGLRPDDEPGDGAHDQRCRRAAVLNALAQLRGDDDMQSEAFRLALIVCHARPDMRPSDVYVTGAPVLFLPAEATEADVDAALCAELAAITIDDGGDEP